MPPVTDNHTPSPRLMRVLWEIYTGHQTGLTFPHILLLCEMAACPETTSAILADGLGVTERGVRSMISRLMSAGCLLVVPGSGRPCRRELTPRGRSIVAALNDAAAPPDKNSTSASTP